MSAAAELKRLDEQVNNVLGSAWEDLRGLIQHIETLTRDREDRDKALVTALRSLQVADAFISGASPLMPASYAVGDIAAAIDACEEYVTWEPVPHG